MNRQKLFEETEEFLYIHFLVSLILGAKEKIILTVTAPLFKFRKKKDYRF